MATFPPFFSRNAAHGNCISFYRIWALFSTLMTSESYEGINLLFCQAILVFSSRGRCITLHWSFKALLPHLFAQTRLLLKSVWIECSLHGISCYRLPYSIEWRALVSGEPFVHFHPFSKCLGSFGSSTALYWQKAFKNGPASIYLGFTLTKEFSKHHKGKPVPKMDKNFVPFQCLQIF